MSSDLYSLLFALGILSVGFISVGPNILAIIGTSMERGRGDGAKLAMGVGLGSAVWATLTVAGFTALVTAYAGAVTLLKIVGVAYLLWLAYKAFRSAMTPDQAVEPKSAIGAKPFFQGIAIQLTNPKAALHWAAIVSLGIGPDAPLWVAIALVVFGTLISVVGHLAYAITFSTAPVIAFYRGFRRWIEGALGVFFCFAAFKLATFRN